ncbi:ABC transporter substrate-binding protein [Speluncibacter jeojiensis]|uniref:ABC transporter substrate-binding protein n=1 Tax=Speluncibacter jeojiensis TaxID=2710754 RepID=UPI00240F8927|nr:ABC transporter substrate-binding protein [Rhodococcus sp. D2-41]
MHSRIIGGRSIRRLVVALTTGALALTVAACGSDDTAPAAGPAVTIEHTLGSTTITGVPQRIVTLGSQWLDATESLGVTPVGYIDNVALTTGGTPAPWEPAALADSKQIDAKGDIVEQVAALRPDLILAPGFATDRQTYDQLSKLAPTIPNLGTEQVEPWDEEVEIMGRILHREDRAKQVVADVNGEIDALAQQNPGLKGKTFVTSFLASPTQLMVLADPKDGASALFERLGMQLPAHLVAEVGSAGRTALSPERLGDLDSDLLVITSPANLTDSIAQLPGYDELPAVRKGAVAKVDLATGTGINVPTPLSIPYVLDKLTPALVNAAK